MKPKPINPLSEALKRRGKPMEISMQRTLEVHGHELGGKVAPGATVHAHVTGRAKTVHDDGRVIVEVQKVQNSKQEENQEPN